MGAANVNNLFYRLDTSHLIVGHERAHQGNFSFPQNLLQRLEVHHAGVINGNLGPGRCFLLVQPGDGIEGGVVFGKSGSDSGGHLGAVLALVSPHASLESSVDGFCPPRGKNDLDRMGSHHGGNPFPGVFHQCPGSTTTSVKSARVSGDIHRLEVSLFHRLGHRAGGLVIEINRHGVRTSKR